MYFDKLNLASGSPRRSELAKSLFNEINVLMPLFVEPRWSTGDSFLNYITHCVKAKWKAVEDNFSNSHSGELFLVADTIVVLGKEVLGKPLDSADAVKMLTKLSGREHLVPTAFQLGRLGSSGPEVHFEVVESRVRFRKLSLPEIKAYVKTREPLDKAGAYGFQGLGMQLIAEVDGPYTNIMGLPILAVKAAAEKLGIKKS